MPIDNAAYEGDIVSRLKNWRSLHLAHGGELFEEAAAEIASLREAIRRLAEQDATLSVQGGNVTVTMDATLTDEEREAVEAADAYMSAAGCRNTNVQKTLRERERTNHDAVPAARAEEPESSVPRGSGSALANTPAEPVAWVAFATDLGNLLERLGGER